MKIPRMDTFRLPVSPSHVAVTAGLALVQLVPGLRPEPKAIVTGAIVGVYVLGETIYSSVRAKKVELPAELLQLKADVQKLEEGR
jgi:hypothetical protein